MGGLVRDTLLGRQTWDLDITVTSDAVAVARRLADALGGAFVLLDEPRQMARVVVQHNGDSWHVDLASLQGDRLQDLARRDFTIDAMSVPLSMLLSEEWHSSVLDPFGGMRDLEAGLLRAVNPGIFQEDGLRLLRAVRLVASLEFDIEAGTRDLIRRDASALAGVSGERVRDELLAILASRQAVGNVYVLDGLGLLCQVVPELEEGRGVTQPREHHWDIFHHNVEAVGAVEGLLERTWEPRWILEAVPWDDATAGYFQEMAGEGHTRGTLLKLAGLLHDIAKPATRTVDTEGRIRFLGHHGQGAIMAGTILQRLRFSGRSTRMIETEIEHHLRPGQMRPGRGVGYPAGRVSLLPQRRRRGHRYPVPESGRLPGCPRAFAGARRMGGLYGQGAAYTGDRPGPGAATRDTAAGERQRPDGRASPGPRATGGPAAGGHTRGPGRR